MRRLLRASALVAVLAAFSCHREQTSEGERFPSAPVEILIDDMGVPHVFAKNDADAFYGAGYQMASDRLYQMEMLRRFAYGRLAEVLGEAGFERDRQARTFDLPRWGRADADLMRRTEPERARLLRAWVAGINARISEVREGKAPLPFGYRPSEHDFLPEPWTDDDPYIVLKGAGLALDKTIEFDIAVTMLFDTYPTAMSAIELLKPARPVFAIPPEDRPTTSAKMVTPRDDRAPLPGIDAAHAFESLERMRAAIPRAGGSNNWAIDGRFTESGKPLIAGDPHLSFEFFGAPYPMHIDSKSAGGTYSVAGFAYPGTPGIALGHNDKMIWTATSAFADVTDVWRVKRSERGVFIGGKDIAIATRTESIVVREPGKRAGEGHTETIEYEDVPDHGVILPTTLLPIPVGGPFLVGWTGFTARPSRWFLELNRVQSLDEFEAAVDRMREMNYSFVAADATGIAYRVGVDVPKRTNVGGARAPWRAMDGNDPLTLWTGTMLDRAQLPRGRAKTRGYLATANNDPFGFTANGRVDDDPWYYGALFDPGFRAQRIDDELSRLTKKGAVTIDDVQKLQLDVRSTLADDLLPLLEAAYAKIGTDASLDEFKADSSLDALVKLLSRDWDRRMARDSKGALAFEAFMHMFTREAIGDDIKLGYDFAIKLETMVVVKVAMMAARGDYPDAAKILQGGKDPVLLRAARKTAAFLAKRFGSVDAIRPYGELKRTSFDHAFGYGVPLFSTPTDGGEDTINVSQQIVFDENADAWPSNYVSVERTLGTFGADGVPEIRVTFPLAGYADPKSTLTQSLNADYVEGRHRALLFRRPEIEAKTVTKITLLAR